MEANLDRDILDSINVLVATKYVSATGVALVVWDHFLNFRGEVDVIWKPTTHKLAKAVYVVHRYGLQAAFLFVVYIEIGLSPGATSNNQMCKAYSTIIGLATLLSSLSGNAYIAWRHYALWDYRRIAIVALLTALVIIYTIVLAFGIMLMKEWFVISMYSQLVNTCVIATKPTQLFVVFAAMLSFDVFTITLAFINNLDRPHRYHSDILEGLRRDGAIIFVTIFLLRLSIVVIFIVLPPLKMFVHMYLLWALMSITTTRLILRVEALKGSGGSVNTWVPARNSYEMDHWSQPEI